MKIDFHRSFDKQFSSLSQKRKEQFKQRLAQFDQDLYRPTLNNHALRGKFQGYRSINVTGDLRAVFKMRSKNHVEFAAIGTHSKLYG